MAWDVGESLWIRLLSGVQRSSDTRGRRARVPRDHQTPPGARRFGRGAVRPREVHGPSPGRHRRKHRIRPLVDQLRSATLGHELQAPDATAHGRPLPIDGDDRAAVEEGSRPERQRHLRPNSAPLRDSETVPFEQTSADAPERRCQRQQARLLRVHTPAPGGPERVLPVCHAAAELRRGLHREDQRGSVGVDVRDAQDPRRHPQVHREAGRVDQRQRPRDRRRGLRTEARLQDPGSAGGEGRDGSAGELHPGRPQGNPEAPAVRDVPPPEVAAHPQVFHLQRVLPLPVRDSVFGLHRRGVR